MVSELPGLGIRPKIFFALLTEAERIWTFVVVLTKPTLRVLQRFRTS